MYLGVDLAPQGSHNGYTLIHHQIKPPTTNIMRITLDTLLCGRYIFIQKEGNGILEFTEVEVMGV